MENCSAAVNCCAAETLNTSNNRVDHYVAPPWPAGATKVTRSFAKEIDR
jgi:hypothetical protein